MKSRYVDEDGLLRAVGSAARNALGEAGYPRGVQQDVAQGTRERVKAYLASQQRAPHLVSSKRAAEMLGIHQPHLQRLRDQGRLPAGVPVEGAYEVYVREDIEELAETLREERRARARRRASRAA